MKRQEITRAAVDRFVERLRAAERSPGTVEKYARDVRELAVWLGGRPVTRELAAAWRGALLEEGRAPATVNSKVAAVNQFFAVQGWEACRIKALKIQRRLFRDDRRELTREEYERLLSAAWDQGRERLALLLETICATGIRVSEVRYITVEAARSGRAEIALKGKLRTILLPGKLCRKLKKYARAQKTASGEIFLTRSGKSLSRRQIWGGDEEPVQKGRSGPLQGLSPQPAASVRPDLLPGVPGYCEAGRRAGTQLGGDYTRLSDLHRRGARQGAGQDASAPINKIRVLLNRAQAVRENIPPKARSGGPFSTIRQKMSAKSRTV